MLLMASWRIHAWLHDGGGLRLKPRILSQKSLS